ncbi:VOC family protein [Nocardioides sp. SYSU D00038]|uniref:VOC family protein n=1 Tax=Nocardioides sp. SYSU D00038 TaxID=2812554 RepID=UPI00196824F3|nr:VOC family protein [Nocardioides sp. SYSU D00038]
MTAFVSHTTIDCHDAYALSEWWREVLGYVTLPDDPNEAGDEECFIQDPESGHALLFIQVPDTKTVKNRLHLDLRPRTAARDAELEVLVAHGAEVLADHRGIHGPGTGWVVLGDPEGNEFCILRSEAELDAAE